MASQETLSSVPTDQAYIEATSSSDAVYFRRVVIAENTYMTAIPIRTITVGVTFLKTEKRIIAPIGIKENMNALIIKPVS